MYALLEQLTLQAAFPLAALCETLEVSRAGYYAWRSESQSAQEQRGRELTPLVCNIFWKNKRRYGARRIAVELRAMGQPCGVDRVAKLLKIQGLRAIQPKSYKPNTTNSQHSLGYSPNLLLRRPPPTTHSIVCGSPISPKSPFKAALPFWLWFSISARDASSAGAWPTTQPSFWI